MSTSIPFSDVETLSCPKCGSEADSKCRIMAGKGVTGKTKIAPHIERCIRYIDSMPAPNRRPTK